MHVTLSVDTYFAVLVASRKPLHCEAARHEGGDWRLIKA
jgi:hypothetical protein